MKVAFVGATEDCWVWESEFEVLSESPCACLFDVSDKPVMGTVGVSWAGLDSLPPNTNTQTMIMITAITPMPMSRGSFGRCCVTFCGAA